MTKMLFLLSFLFVTINGQVVGPKLSVPEKSFDFGDINEGDVVKHTFTIYNTGDDLLVIKDVKSSCGCTAALPDKKELKPGESTGVKVEFNSAKRKGQQRKHVYLTTNDPENKEIRLTFTTNILVDQSKKVTEQPRMKLSRTQHDFGTVSEGKVLELDVDFKNVGKDELVVKDVKSSCGCTAALLSSKKLKPGETGKIKIELDTSDRVGKFTRTVTLYTNEPDLGQQTITLFVNVKKRDT
ncbi:MAG: hypothetical protein CMF23_12835 [Ignavibacteriae bacterium]|nr:hypothetical protein [Ignavibacteriota bacterium]|tara:strand:+ start:625 stop:1344 length:720 start_codon:yes stop_codon:yes gene_type:complete